jgi:hypothetical protein
LDVAGLEKILVEAEKHGRGAELKERAAILRVLLDARADKKGLVLRRRK